jgi:DNA adenine methylase
MDLNNKSRKELIELCKSLGKKGYSSKKKEDLILLLKEDKKMFNSPLRYPGGKSRAVEILTNILEREFGKDKKILLSPFFGGGSFEIFSSKKYKIVGNDIFKPLYNFWESLKNNKNKLVENILKIKRPVSKEEFLNFRKNIMENFTDNNIDIATLFFVINRCSFSGSTFCGGFSKEASGKRFTDSSIERLKDTNLENFTFSNLDFEEFLSNYPENSETIIYADPPYYIKSYIYGKDGDLHEKFDHERFFKVISKRKDWILSYNDCEYIRNLYKDFRIEKVEWAWSMNNGKDKSKEIIILPNL